MSQEKFDDSNIPWQNLKGFDGVGFFIYKADPESRIVDVIYKFAPNMKQPLHRHKCPYFTLVLQGELRFYRQDGALKEVRPVGSYVNGVVNGEPHFEGAGDEETIVFFGHHDVGDAMYEFVDAEGRQEMVLGLSDFRALFDQQVADGVMSKVAARAA
ncbi:MULTISPECIES: regulator [unclassified Methylobacterium]|uniref:regulator n=1 Tax=unclassified Methylobacterium TaxID=2615210 RepID=UPI00226A6CDA|nr:MULTISPECIES: regulator [unclassified Methylobacterium]